MTATNRSSARRANRSILELARILSDGEWHGIGFLTVAAGKYLRPEVAWRCSGGSSMQEGQRRYIDKKLRQWEKLGRVEKRRNGDTTEWRLSMSAWVSDYTVELDRRRSTIRRLNASPMGDEVSDKAPEHKPGRPRALTASLTKLAVNLYRQGHGYRAIARMLQAEGANPSFGTIRNIIKAQKTV